MTRPARHLLVLALVAWHCLATVVGPCGHALAGSNHQASNSATRGIDDRATDPAASPADDDAADCPVCQFVAQAQLGADLLPPTAGVAVAPLDPSPVSLHLDSAPTHPTQPRAPPCPAPSLRASA